MRILVAEDNENINESLVAILKENGYSVDATFDGQEALEYINMVEYDAVILDIMMPKLDGFTVLEKMRKNGNKTPVLFLTAKSDISDKVKGLDLGADDYLAKPFSNEELLARLRVLVRRKTGNVDNVYTVADLSVDINKKQVIRDGKSIELSAKEFAILEYLIQNTGVVLSREQILEHVWDFDYFGGSNVVDVYINYLRKKIDSDFENKLIKTIRGSGYVLREG